MVGDLVGEADNNLNFLTAEKQHYHQTRMVLGIADGRSVDVKYCLMIAHSRLADLVTE